MPNSKSKFIHQTLTSSSFPKLFYVKYAVAVAKYAVTLIDKADPGSLRAIDLAERYSLGEDIKPDALREAANVAPYSAAFWAAYSPLADSVAHAASYAVSYAIYAAMDRGKAEADLRAMLISLMDKEFNEFELLMMKL